MVYSLQHSTQVAAITMLSEIQLPEEDRPVSCGLQICSTEKLLMRQGDEDSNSRCICSGKRKGQDDVAVQDAKFSKSSPTIPEVNPVFSFMQKWTKAPLSSENLFNETLKEQKTSNPKWMVNQQDDPNKENQPLSEEEPMDNCLPVNKSFTDPESLSLSERHMASNTKNSERKTNKSSFRRSKAKINKKISALQSDIEICEQEFQARKGYRPSYADKINDEELCKLIDQQTKLKQELKELKEQEGDSRKNSLELKRTVEEERDLILENLSSMRLRSGRPYELFDMTPEELKDEKFDMESQLLEFEKKHGQPINKTDKEVMSCLYERYRQVKRCCRRSSNEMVVIPEEETINLTLASPKRRMSVDITDQKLGVKGVDEFVTISKAKTLIIESKEKKDVEETNEENWHTMSFGELSMHLKRLKQFKKNFRENIKDFETNFQSTTGRNVTEDDRQPMEKTYFNLKVIKSKIRLIKALLDKPGQ